MLKHIVLFKMKKGAGSEDAHRLADELKLLKQSTDGLMVECEVGLDIMHTETSYDIVLDSLFHSTGDLERYRVHPEHVKVLNTIKELCQSVVKIDYET